jgi:hypothetical protein
MPNIPLITSLLLAYEQQRSAPINLVHGISINVRPKIPYSLPGGA